jgi:hypothetical protein
MAAPANWTYKPFLVLSQVRSLTLSKFITGSRITCQTGLTSRSTSTQRLTTSPIIPPGGPPYSHVMFHRTLCL